MNAAECTTTVTITLDHRPTIEEVQDALDTLRAEGIPDTFEVSIEARADRKYEANVPYEDRIETYTFTVKAERVAKHAATA